MAIEALLSGLPFLGGGGGGTTTSSSSSTSQSTNTLSFAPTVNIGTGTTFGEAAAQADPVSQSNAAVDNTPTSAAGFDFAPTSTQFTAPSLAPASLDAGGLPWWALPAGAAVIGSAFLWSRS